VRLVLLNEKTVSVQQNLILVVTMDSWFKVRRCYEYARKGWLGNVTGAVAPDQFIDME
jgi:hypothetical protein